MVTTIDWLGILCELPGGNQDSQLTSASFRLGFGIALHCYPDSRYGGGGGGVIALRSVLMTILSGRFD